MTAPKEGFTERIWLDLLFKGSIIEFHRPDGPGGKLEEALAQMSELLAQMEAKISIGSQRAKPVEFGDLVLAHVNITLVFRSKTAMTDLFWKVIWPSVYNRLRGIIDHGACQILEDIHSGDYFQAMGKQANEMTEGVVQALARDHPEVPPEFARTILAARPHNAP